MDGGPQRADALRRDDRNEPRLTAQRERPPVARRIGVASCCEAVILVANEHDVAPPFVRRCSDLRNARENGPLEVEFQHHTGRAGKAGIRPDREVQRHDLSRFQQILHRRQRRAVLLSRPGRPGVRGLWGTECPAHSGVVVEQRQEHDDAFDNGRAGRGSRRPITVMPSASRPAVSRVDPPVFVSRLTVNSERDVAPLQERLELLVVRVNECSSDVPVSAATRCRQIQMKVAIGDRIVGSFVEHLLTALQVPLDAPSSIA